MLDSLTTVAVAVVAVSCLVSGAALLIKVLARLTATFLILTGLALGTAVVAEVEGWTVVASAALVAAGALLGPCAVTAYPRLRWRHPVDFLAVTTIGVCGVLVTLLWNSVDHAEIFAWVLAVVLPLHVWWRIERSEGAERRALIWLALVAGGTLGLALPIVFSGEPVGVSMVGVGVLLAAAIPPTLYVGVSAPEIVDVRALVVDAIGVLVTLVGFICAFVAIDSLLQVLGVTLSGGASAVVAGVLAFGVKPTQQVLRGVVEQILFGFRPDPLGAASQVVGQIGDDPVLALQAIRDALVLPYASAQMDGAGSFASGDEPAHVRVIPLDDSGGRLVVGVRAGHLDLTKDDRQVLNLAAPLLAQTLRARALAVDLQEAREQTVAVLEEERRRLRRDLHDSLGPRLSGIAFTSDAVRNLLRTDPGEAERLLKGVRTETGNAIEEIRRLVYAMRPPALDDLGLVPALRQQGEQLRSRDGSPLAVSIDAPEQMPSMSAAVEVAAYRIVVEALTNVARHSGSTTARVQIVPQPGELAVLVTDSSRSHGDWVTGVGISSMRERAAEVGGTLMAGPGVSGGRVEARLPVGHDG